MIRRPEARYEVRRVAADLPQPLVATRAIAVSSLAGDGDAIYFAGYDANKAPAHNTAWIARASRAAALGPSP